MQGSGGGVLAEQCRDSGDRLVPVQLQHRTMQVRDVRKAARCTRGGRECNRERLARRAVARGIQPGDCVDAGVGTPGWHGFSWKMGVYW